MSLDETWKNKSDAQVRMAAQNLKDYKPEAHAVIKAEFERRQMHSGLTEEEILLQPDPRLVGAATVGRRVAARFIDSLVISLPSLTIVSFLPLAQVQLGFVVMALFQALCVALADALPGSSPGKRALKITVVTYDGRKPCTVSRSFLRNVLLLTPISFIDMISIFRKDGRRIGDLIAGTIVITRRKSKG